jgi:hypothetical protein
MEQARAAQTPPEVQVHEAAKGRSALIAAGPPPAVAPRPRRLQPVWGRLGPLLGDPGGRRRRPPSHTHTNPFAAIPSPNPTRQSDQRLAVPHISVADIRWVKWDALRAAGFKACVFDKDNTLCEPFALEINPALKASVEACRAAFGGRLAIYSNSAGLGQYDPQGGAAWGRGKGYDS